MEQVTLLAEAGQLELRLEPTSFTLDTAEAAHALVGSGRARGTAVVGVLP